MSNEVNYDVHPALAAEMAQAAAVNPPQSQPEPEIQEVPQQAQPEVPVAPEPEATPADKSAQSNFRILRQERDELKRRITELEAQQQRSPELPEIDVDPESYVEGKHFKRVASEVKELKAELHKYKQISNETSAEARIKAQYPDFDKVVNADTISALRDAEPELAATLHSTSDIYAKAVSAYKMIKKLGLSPEAATENEKARIAVNAAKPRTVTSLSPQQGDSPLARANAFANGLTDELKSQLLKEMHAARRAV